MLKAIPLFCMMLLLLSSRLHAQVRLPRLVRDSMVLQRDTKVNIWGWASPNEKVSIRFRGRTYSARASAAGDWKLQLASMQAGGPYEMEIRASNTIRLRDILVGDVWFCSGQSNMVHQLNIHDVTYADEIATANYPMIRQFLVPVRGDMQSPQNDLTGGNWKAAVGEDVRPFSAVAYFFAKTISEKYKIPVGIINASVGGTPIEAWTSADGLQAFPEMVKLIKRNSDTSYVNKRARNSQGYRPVPVIDKGETEKIRWHDTAYQASDWRSINVPGYWEDQGLRNLDGIVWYRRTIDVPVSMAGKASRMFLGRIVDADAVYINGVLVGNTTYQYPQRRYRVPAGLLKPGKNSVVVRVSNQQGKGGFVPDKPYCLFADADTIDLKGTWQYKVSYVAPKQSGPPIEPPLNVMNQPAALYNGMVAPLVNYTIKGYGWYQGEANTANPHSYADLSKALIADWREQWKQGSLPFLYVQLPGFMEYDYLPAESNWAMLREAQLKTLAIPNTGMAVAIDLGEWNDIHPDNKKDVGLRLATAALKVAYKEQIVPMGPLYDTAVIDNTRVVVSFTSTGSGLVTSDGEAPGDFAIAGADKKFVWAETKIEGNRVIVWSSAVPEPKYVRYAWADNPVNPNLRNREGLPASPFRTDK